MKIHQMLCVGALTSLAVVAAPVLSQNAPRPGPPGGRQPTTPMPGGMSRQPSGQMQALQALTGTWQITVKTFADGSGSAQGSPSSQATGTSTRNFILDGKILQEDVRCGEMRTLSMREAVGDEYQESFDPQTTTPPSRPPTTPPPTTPPPAPPRPQPPSTPPPMPERQPPSPGMGQAFQGHGMFGFDSTTGQFQHVWCDSTDSKLSMCLGTYDASAKTFTFTKQGASPASLRPSPSPTPPTRTPPGTTDPDDEDKQDQVSPSDPARPGQTPPGQTPPPTPRPTPPAGSGKVDMTGLERVVIRIQGDDRHVVEYYKTGGAKIMEVMYTKSR
ncbi:MAG: DUF1579 domain-containing protein [Phycisphaerales bacterium]|nr:DUF1579 domain-containing protein [Phycisphaerales bacterium]MCI0631104.1 DUF1579 domain-containing protein [Phycisphaerales bacterium]MCI0675438.1 DUF1579 domain-containing protein [Phycisphaerales bacterium]